MSAVTTMKADNNLATPESAASQPVATNFDGLKVGLDHIDGLAYACVPTIIRGGSEKIIVDQITAMATERGSGAVKRMLAREAALARVSLRYREALVHIELEKIGHGRGDIERVEFLEKMLVSAHKRLLAVTDRLIRLDTPLAPRVRVTAHQAQVNLGEVGR